MAHTPNQPFQLPRWLQDQQRAKAGGTAPVALIGRSQRLVQQAALSSGLALASVTTAESFPGLAEFLTDHINEKRIEGLDWFTVERANFSASPRNLHETARSIISVGLPYRAVDDGKPNDGVTRGRISRYAWGEDYHRVLKRRMGQMHRDLEEAFGRPIEARLLVDTARIVDRAVAARAGLGWYGKHSCLIVPGHGSWVLLGELIVDLDLEPSQPLTNNCGRCSICLDRCPTGAIEAPYTVNAGKCLSFQTIEQRGAIPRELRPNLGDWVFGCDVCQEVCPYTGPAVTTDDPDVQAPSVDRRYPPLGEILSMPEERFRTLFARSAVLRAKRRGLARNAAVALGNIGQERDLPALTEALLHHDEPLVRGHVAWALGRFDVPRAVQSLHQAWSAETEHSVREEIELALTHGDGRRAK